MTRGIPFYFAMLVSVFVGHTVHAQSALIYDQENVPALFEEIDSADPRAIEQYDGWTRNPYIKRSRLVKVNFDLLRPIEDGDESYPLYLNLFPDLGFRIYVHRRIERYYGYDWLASPDAEYDGRRFIDLSVSIGDHAHTGLHAAINSKGLGFEGMLIRRMDGTDFVAIIEYDLSTQQPYPTTPELSIRQSASVLLSESSNSFIAEAGVRIDYSALDFYFPSTEVGYFMTVGGEQHGSASKLYKTTDGGRNWAILIDALPGTPVSVHFVDDDEGFISIRRKIRCASGEDCRSRLLKTSDGGKTWEEVENPGLMSIPAILDVRIDDALYGIVRRPSTGSQNWSAILVKSTDGAKTWTDMFEFPIFARIVAASAINHDLYVGFENGHIYIVDTATGDAEKIEIENNGLTDFTVPSANVIVASAGDPGGRKLLKSTDRGASWSIVMEGFFKFVAAPSSEQLVLIINKGSSAPTDTATSSDVIAYSEDGGISWEETALVGGLIMHTERRQSLDSENHKLLLSDRILNIRVPKRN